ncbi:MAG TPA: hypothetical protein VJ396_01155 [Acidiferrobacterales bacterium]|nr:hypothetical protein [Acidiferrobacterales bacterium]
MRTALIIVLLALVAGAAQAEEVFVPQTARGRVMVHECKQVDARATGFSCHFNKDGMRLQFHENQDGMTPERKKKSRYEFDKIALRYLDLGGRHFEVTFDHWPANRKRLCTRPRGWSDNSYTCSDCTITMLNGGGSICE